MNELLIKIRSIIPGVWRFRWIGLSLAILLGTAASMIIALIPNRYEASARVFVDTQTILRPLLQGLTVQPDTGQQVSMMAKTLLSRPNAERIMELSGVGREIKDPAQRDRFIGGLQRNIQFIGAGRDNIYSVTYRDGTPEDAWRVVSALIDVFVERNQGDNQRDSLAARGFIDQQIAIYEKRLIEAENALKQFKLDNIGKMPDTRQDYVARSASARDELSAAMAELRQAISARDALQREAALESPDGGLVNALALSIAPPVTETDRRLQEARKQLDDLSIRYTAEHPDILNIRYTIDQLEARKAAELREFERNRPEIARSLPSTRTGSSAWNTIRAALAQAEASVASLRARVATAQAQLSRTGQAAKDVTEVETALSQLNRDYEINKKSYEDLLARRQSVEITGDISKNANLAEFRIVDPPRVGIDPVSPQRGLLMAAALLGSLLAGLAVTVLLTMMKPTFHDVDSLESATGAPIIGVVTAVLDQRTRFGRRLHTTGFLAAGLLYLSAYVVAALLIGSNDALSGLRSIDWPVTLNGLF